MPSAGRLTPSVPADVSCDEWAFSLLPLDVDLLSMELPEFFRDYFLVSAGSLGLGIDGWGQTWSPVGYSGPEILMEPSSNSRYWFLDQMLLVDIRRPCSGANQNESFQAVPTPCLPALAPLQTGLLAWPISLWPIWPLQEGDQRWINTVAQALHLLSTLYGPFPNCYGIGRCAKVGTGSNLVPLAPIPPVLYPPRTAHGHV